MQNKRWMMWMAVGLVAAVAMGSGCKKKNAPGTGDDGIGGKLGNDLNGTGTGMNPRPGEGSQEERGLYANVYFDYDSAAVKASEQPKVEAVAAGVKKASAGGIIIEGHCDERGSAEYNLALGERRAAAVREYLLKLGVDAARIQTKSLGKEKPAAMGHDEESWSKNRRAEFVVFK